MLALVAVAQFMVILDATVFNVAIPTIRRDLGFSEQTLSWILNALGRALVSPAPGYMICHVNLVWVIEET